MNRLQRFEPIKELSERREQQAALAYGQSQRELEAARKGLASLLSFRDNYSAQFQRSAHEGIGIRRLQEYRAFLDKIHQAIVEQEQRVLSCERDLEAKKRIWQEAHGRALGMQRMVDKLRAQLQKQEQKREQSENDDRASRSGRNDKTLLSVF